MTTAVAGRYCQRCGRGIYGSRCPCGQTSLAERPPNYSRVHCRECGGVMRWRLEMTANGRHPPILYWACLTCEAMRYQYADCTNVTTMCATVLDENLRKTGANLDYEDALGQLGLEAFRLYVAWRPERGLTFESYGFGLLRRRAYDIYRSLLGRNGEKPLAHAISFETFTGDDPADAWRIDPEDPNVDKPGDLRLEQALSGGAVDGPEHRASYLSGIHEARDRELLRAVVQLGFDEVRQAAPRDAGPRGGGDE